MTVRVLHAAPFSPYRTDTGGHVRLRASADAMNAQMELHGLYVEDPDVATSCDLPFTSELVAAAHRHDRGRLERFRRLRHLAELTVGGSRTETFAAAAGPVAARIAARARNFDVTVIEFSQLAPCRPVGHPAVLVAYDLLWRKLEAQARQVTASGPLRQRLERSRMAQEAAAVRPMEARLYAAFDAVVLVSEPDRMQLEKAWTDEGVRFPPVYLAENGVNLRAFAPVAACPPEAGTVAFVGGLDHPPNLDAANAIANDIEPRLGAAARRILIAGRHTDREWPGRIEGLGSVRDIRDVYRRAALTIAPISWGSGTRLKIIESLAAGRPVVAFAPAAEGLEHVTREHGLIVVGSAEQLCAEVERLLIDDVARAELAVAGMRAIARHDWDLTLLPLIAAVRAAARLPHEGAV